MNLKEKLCKFASKVKFGADKNSPEILLGLGIAGIIGTVVLASKATLTADDILKHHTRKMQDIKEAVEVAEENPDNYEYDTTLQAADKGTQLLKTTGSLLKVYAPAIALGTVSIGCILASRNIMQKRYLGVVTAYNGLSEAFNLYRKRVIEEEGADKDYYYRTGQRIVETEVVNEDGTTETIKTVEGTPDPKSLTGDGSLIFGKIKPDGTPNLNWDENFNLTMMFLRAQENVATDMLHAKGHLFLNEVYDLLGFPDTSVGAVTGWVDELGDGYVDFGLSLQENTQHHIGDDYSIVLDFNHDGPMYDKI